MNKVERLVCILIFIMFPVILWGQNDSLKHRTDTLPDSFIVLQKVYRDGEELPEMEIKEVTIAGSSKNISRRQARVYDRLIYNVRRVYPYALIVRMKLEEVNNILAQLPDENERKKFLREFEKQIFREYEDDMRQLTITQGKILIKLIDRETQNTSYDLIKTYRGTITAAFWQGVARIFGANLKARYDPYGEDAIIESIIYGIENGYF
ncbi:MAG TPA: DUF4294 domain-containing protein [Bacteroidales bacterium]|nr:DUF4294 domain-containing protein [Bacteroidales bacterium]